MYTNEEILHSLDMHFVLIDSITARQVREHKARLSCRECDERTTAIAVAIKAGAS